MSTALQKLKSNSYAFTAALIALTGILPSLLAAQSVAAYTQITSRSIQMSSAAPSASATYQVSFKPSQSMDLQGIVIEFCDDSPIIGSTTCTATAGTDVPNVSATPTVAFTSGGTGTWSAASSNGSTVKITNNGTANNVTSASTVTFTLASTVTNPSATGTFYARIYTYTTAAGASGYSLATPGSYSDAGGIALSVTNTVNVSATVQESLTFCVSKAAPGSGCSGTSTPDLTLGTGTPKILDANAVYTDSLYYQLSTNAAGTTNVNMKSSSINLTNGSNNIPAYNAGASATPGALVAGTTGAYGMHTESATVGSYTVTANSAYDDNTTNYNMRTAVSSTYGDSIGSATGPVLNVNVPLTFAAIAGSATPAGVYTSQMSLIATPSY